MRLDHQEGKHYKQKQTMDRQVAANGSTPLGSSYPGIESFVGLMKG